MADGFWVERTPENVPCWAFHPKPRSERSRDEDPSFRRRRDSALRAGHGLGAEFSLRLHAGAEPVLFLEAWGTTAHRWVTRVLLATYERSQWRTSRQSAAPLLTPALFGRRVRSWPTRLGEPAEAASILDVWAMALTSLSSDVVLVLRFRPVPLGPLSWWELPGLPPESARALVPTAPRTGPGPVGFRATAPLSNPRPAAAWMVSARLSCAGCPDGRPKIRGAAEALERAARDGQGNGIVFRRANRWPLGTPAGFLVVPEEVGLFLPSPECPVFPRERTGSPDEILPLGRTPVGIVVGTRLDPGQGRHLAILGETGMGKSSLLVALAQRVSRTHGLVLLDPLGATATALERELGLSARERLVHIAPGEAPLRINALEGVAVGEREDPVRSERRLNDLIHSLRRVRAGRYTDSAYWGPRLEEMLTRAVRAAAALPSGTLTDAHLLLESGGRLPRNPPALAMGPIRELADRIRDRPEDAEGARRLLHEIVRSPVLERMLCSRSPDLRPSSLVEPGRIVVVSGEAGVVGESTARYLLSVYLALVWSEALSRPSRAKLFVMLDEAQWFSHDSLAEMLQLGRSANLHVVLATQAVGSLPPSVAESVWTNVADFVAFRGSPEEAREFARAAHGVSTESVLSLPRGHAVVLLGKGRATHWLRTLRLPNPSPSEAPGGPRTEATTFTPSGDPVPPPPPVTAEEVLTVVRSRARLLPADAPLRISLEDLRRTVDPSGLAIRQAGSILGQAGAILASEKREGGTVWTLSTTRIPGPRGGVRDEDRSGDAGPPQPS